MRLILWLGVMPLIYGLRLMWRWTVADRRVWDSLPEAYRRGFPLRVAIASALILFGAALNLNLVGFLNERLFGERPAVSQSADGQLNYASLELPPVPSVEEPELVVDWFLHHDAKISDYKRNYPETLASLREDILLDLANHPDAEGLLAHVDDITAEWAALMLEVGRRYEEGEPLFGDNEEDAGSLLYREAYLAAKMRVLGYFLLEEYGIGLEGRLG